MSTKILKLITSYCFPRISEDIELEELLRFNKPLFARKCFAYLERALPNFNIPEAMQKYIYGTPFEPDFYPPEFAGTVYTLTQTEDHDFVVALGEEYAGFELSSCRVWQKNSDNEVCYLPVSYSYDPETGAVTVNASADRKLPAGTVLEFDFYSDGEFKNDLTPEMMSIIGMLWEIEWLSHLFTDKLDLLPTIDDKSFSVQNRANKMKSDADLVRQKRNFAISEMRRFEQNGCIRDMKKSGYTFPN